MKEGSSQRGNHAEVADPAWKGIGHAPIKVVMLTGHHVGQVKSYYSTELEVLLDGPRSLTRRRGSCAGRSSRLVTPLV